MTDQLETDNESAWWAGPRFLVSAVLVALLAVLGLVLWLWPDDDEQPQSQPSPAATTEAVSGAESVCGLDATGGTTLTKAPKDVQWTVLGAMYAPESKKHGPGMVDPATGVRSCYSHTPEGALLTTTNMLAASGNTELLLATTRELGLDGPGKEVAIGGLQKAVAQGDNSSVPVQIAGFRLLSYTEDKATVEVVAAADDGSEKIYITTAGDLVWQDGDWRFVFKDDGSGGPVSGRVSDLTGYIMWGPHNG